MWLLFKLKTSMGEVRNENNGYANSIFLCGDTSKCRRKMSFLRAFSYTPERSLSINNLAIPQKDNFWQ